MEKNLTNNELIAFAQLGDEGAVEKIIKDNDCIVRELAKRYCKFHFIEYDDIYQEGLIALWMSIKKFDLNKDLKFSTYAWNNVKGAILHYIRNEARHVHENIDDTLIKCDIDYINDVINSVDAEAVFKKLKTILTEEEQQIVCSLIDGDSKQTIAKKRNISRVTLYKKIESIANKIRGVL